jgi:4a-hydroxytetrahydrobiopterin dehydratase
MSHDISGSLARRQCVPCRGGVPPLSAERVAALRLQISDGWKVVDGHHLLREVKRRNFRESLNLANSIGEIAESQRHHPDLLVSWGKLTITLFTHAIDGLHENDFILAARIDELLAADEHPGGVASSSGHDSR